MRLDSRETVADEKDQLEGWQGWKWAQTPVGAEEVGRRGWMLDRGKAETAGLANGANVVVSRREESGLPEPWSQLFVMWQPKQGTQSSFSQGPTYFFLFLTQRKICFSAYKKNNMVQIVFVAK